MASRRGDGVRYPPPLSGGSKLDNLRCGVEKKQFRAPSRLVQMSDQSLGTVMGVQSTLLAVSAMQAV